MCPIHNTSALSTCFLGCNRYGVAAIRQEAFVPLKLVTLICFLGVLTWWWRFQCRGNSNTCPPRHMVVHRNSACLVFSTAAVADCGQARSRLLQSIDL